MARYSSICLSPRYVRNVQWKPMIRVRSIVSARTRVYQNKAWAWNYRNVDSFLMLPNRNYKWQNEYDTHTHTHTEIAARKRQNEKIKTGRTTSSFNTWNARKITMYVLRTKRKWSMCLCWTKTTLSLCERGDTGDGRNVQFDLFRLSHLTLSVGRLAILLESVWQIRYAKVFRFSHSAAILHCNRNAIAYTL